MKQKTKNNWGKPKECYFDFTQIKSYHEYKQDTESAYTISDKVAKDLDFESFFKLIDRTHSAIGQQYIYDQLRNIKCDQNALSGLEERTNYYTKNDTSRSAIQAILSKLSTANDYYFPFLIFGALPDRINFLGLVKGLQAAIITLIIGGFFYKMLFLPILLLFGVNMGIHYWHKKRIGNFIHLFYRLNKLTEIGRKLLPHTIESDKKQIAGALKNVDSLTSKVAFLKTDLLQNSEIGSIVWYFFEMIKIGTLSEVTLFHKLIDQITDKRDDIEAVYIYIGQIDMALSIGSLREGLPFYCKPIFTTGKKALELTSIYHPLVTDCVANNLHLQDKSLLLTGSNMSGKSTFIKAVSLNAIASQVLNTSFSKAYQAPVFALSTSIQISDNINESQSYYLEEVVSIGDMLEQTKRTEVQYLFVIDEVFKGTNTIERISAAKAILSYLNKENHFVLVSTHDIELTRLLEGSYDLYYFQECIENETLSFDYKLKQGALKNKNAIKILELAGYPESIVAEAKHIAETMEGEKQKHAFKTTTK